MRSNFQKLICSAIISPLCLFFTAENVNAKSVHLSCAPFRVTIDYDTLTFTITDQIGRQSFGQAQVSNETFTLRDLVGETWFIDRHTLKAAVLGRRGNVNTIRCEVAKNKI